MAFGGNGSGNSFHVHGPALNGVLVGEKHWYIVRPNASRDFHHRHRLPMNGEPVSMRDWAEGASADGAFESSWRQNTWQFRQAAGDPTWVPDAALWHGVVNHGEQVLAVAT